MPDHHEIKLSSPADGDEELIGWLKEAYTLSARAQVNSAVEGTVSSGSLAISSTKGHWAFSSSLSERSRILRDSSMARSRVWTNPDDSGFDGIPSPS
jgi:hypothetical protein